jgi:hypothetical protein
MLGLSVGGRMQRIKEIFKKISTNCLDKASREGSNRRFEFTFILDRIVLRRGR